MRTLVAWLLIIVASVYLLGGYLCFRGMYAVAIEKPMTAEEHAIVEKLRSETGMRPRVRILSDEQVNPRGSGYSGAFFFSAEVEGEEVHYVIDQDPVQIVDLEYFIGRYSDRDQHTNQAVLLARLFSPFIINEVSVADGQAADLICAANFRFKGLRDLFTSSIPTPPPKLA